MLFFYDFYGSTVWMMKNASLITIDLRVFIV